MPNTLQNSSTGHVRRFPGTQINEHTFNRPMNELLPQFPFCHPKQLEWVSVQLCLYSVPEPKGINKQTQCWDTYVKSYYRRHHKSMSLMFSPLKLLTTTKRERRDIRHPYWVPPGLPPRLCLPPPPPRAGPGGQRGHVPPNLVAQTIRRQECKPPPLSLCTETCKPHASCAHCTTTCPPTPGSNPAPPEAQLCPHLFPCTP